jgi:threonine dehydrogenase-like Zn-dependent dehydrogenase
MDTRRGGCTCAIIGAGLGGIALIANMGLQGYRLRLHDLNEARIAKVRERGGLDVEGLVEGFAPVELVTAELAPAVDGADVIIVVTGSHFHSDVARGLAPLLKDGHKYVIEDVPCGLVAMSALGSVARVPTPVIDGLITLTSAMLRREFRAEGRNLERLGLGGKRVPEVQTIVDRELPA